MAIFGSKTESSSAKAPADAKAMAGKTSDKEKKDDKPSSIFGKVSDDLIGVLVQPRVSEKSGKAAALNKYIFVVANKANKISVRKAVEGSYKVKVTQVNIIRVSGKNRNFGRMSGRTQNFKKAIVTLKPGDKIEGITETI